MNEQLVFDIYYAVNQNFGSPFFMKEIGSFYNKGFGWLCRPCELELSTASDNARHSRAFREGEAESKNPTLANTALAKWTDKTRRFLTCPRCGITEPVEKS